ncbi:hypothetical protein AHAS_Ahas11G0170400 [Arachis hypogaea]
MLSNRRRATKRWRSSGMQRQKGENGHGDSHENGCNHTDAGVERRRTPHLKRENNTEKL